MGETNLENEVVESQVDDLGNDDGFEDDDLFADFDGEDDLDNDDLEANSEAVGGVQGQETNANTETFTIKHNGQEVTLTKDELITNAQKGFDYDRIREDRERLRNAREIQFVEQLARNANMTKEQFIATFETNMSQQQINQRAQQLMTDMGLEADKAIEIAQIEHENNKLKMQQQQAQQVQMSQQQAIQQQQMAFGQLLQMYPDFAEKYPSFDKIPSEFVQAIEGGLTPIAAYQQLLLQEKENQIKMYQQNKTNQQRATGSTASKADTASDPFLAELFD